MDSHRLDGRRGTENSGNHVDWNSGNVGETSILAGRGDLEDFLAVGRSIDDGEGYRAISKQGRHI